MPGKGDCAIVPVACGSASLRRAQWRCWATDRSARPRRCSWRAGEILDETIPAQPLIGVRWGHRVVDVRQVGDGVTVRAETANGPVDIEAAYAVACAGARADELRERLGVAFQGQSYDDRGL